MPDLALAFLILGLFVLLTGLLSIPLERFPLLSRPMIAFLTGMAVGPIGLGLLQPARWSDPPDRLLQLTAELTMAIAVMGVALRLPSRYFSKHRRDALLMLGVVMPAMALLSGGLVLLLLGLPFWVALLVGAVVTPTDPVLASSVVMGAVARENLPARLRQLLSAEAGANDGLALPLVFLPLLMLMRAPIEATHEWLLRIVLWETLVGVVLGFITGGIVGKLEMAAQKRHWMEEPSVLAVTLALTLFVFGLGRGIGVNPIIAVFAAGVGFEDAARWDAQETEQKIQESIDQFFAAPIFIVFGLYLPVDDWLALGWPLVALVTAILLLRRLPVVLLIGRSLTEVRGRREALFAGWFGPIGVAAIYYALVARRQTGESVVWTVASLMVCASIVVHGMTAPWLTRRLGTQEREGQT